MPDPTSEKNLARYTVSRFDKSTPFCLADVMAYRADDPNTQQKVEDLLESRVVRRTDTVVERTCNIGGCTLRATESTKDGRTVTGECRAASYCLKLAFAAVAEAADTETGRALYADIIESFEGHASKYSAGNFCPRLACGLSAGVSVDMVPGTAGSCVAESQQDQQRLEFEQV